MRDLHKFFSYIAPECVATIPSQQGIGTASRSGREKKGTSHSYAGNSVSLMIYNTPRWSIPAEQASAPRRPSWGIWTSQVAKKAEGTPITLRMKVLGGISRAGTYAPCIDTHIAIGNVQ